MRQHLAYILPFIRSWLTTVTGGGAGLTLLHSWLESGDTHALVAGVLMLLFGAAARDSNVTSEGTKVPPPKE